jgi:hypothetical protein
MAAIVAASSGSLWAAHSKLGSDSSHCVNERARGRRTAAHFSDRGRLFQADRGRRFSAIVDARRLRASGWFNVSQSSTISLKCHADGRLRT